MTLQNVIDLAKNGSLKNVAIKNDTEAKVGYVNLGLIELYKRFAIDTEEVVITIGSDGDNLNKYTKISDTIYQMPDDFMYLISAYGEIASISQDMATFLPINEEDNPLGINTISWNKVQIPIATTGAHISLIYASAPQYFTSDDLAETIPLPVQLIEPLVEYLGYQGRSSINAAEQETNIQYQRFETSCLKVRELGIFTTDDLDMHGRWAGLGFA